MPIFRLNHAVLYVRDLERSVAFYGDVPASRPSCACRGGIVQAPGSTDDHDLGLFQIGAAAGPRRPGGAPWASTTWPGGRHPGRAGAPGGPAGRGPRPGRRLHYGTTKTLYAKDPDGLEFEVAWVVPADLLDTDALAAPSASAPSTWPGRRTATAPTPRAASASRSPPVPATPYRRPATVDGPSVWGYLAPEARCRGLSVGAGVADDAVSQGLDADVVAGVGCRDPLAAAM